MAVPTPRTWADNDSLNTTNLNTGVRDPIQFAQNPSAAVAERSTTQSIPNAVGTAVSFDVEHFDNDAMFAPTSTQITVVEDGLYDLSGFVSWASNATGYRSVQLALNGTRIVGNLQSTHTGVAVGVSVACTRNLTAGDNITLVVDQNSGSALNVDTTLGRPQLSVRRSSGTPTA